MRLHRIKIRKSTEHVSIWHRLEPLFHMSYLTMAASELHGLYSLFAGLLGVVVLVNTATTYVTTEPME